MTKWFYYDENTNLPLCSDGSERPYFLSMFGADTKLIQEK